MPVTFSAVAMSLALFAPSDLSEPSATAPGQKSDTVPVIVPAEWLTDRLRDENVIVVAVDFGRRRAAYDSAHIAGARFLAYEAFAQPRNGLTTELPPLVTLDSILESIGLSDRSRIVIYGPAILSHRLFVTLDVSGFRGRVGLLNGGLEAWRAASGPVTDQRPRVRAGSVILRPVLSALVNREWVRAHLNDPGFQFIDGRQRRRFDAVRLPGALSIPASTVLASGASRDALVSRDSLDTVFATARVSSSKETVAYCAIGETASVLYVVLRSLGRSVRLYDGSMEEWTADPNAPVEKGEPRQ